MPSVVTSVWVVAICGCYGLTPVGESSGLPIARILGTEVGAIGKLRRVVSLKVVDTLQEFPQLGDPVPGTGTHRPQRLGLGPMGSPGCRR
jgi:hypothetical protein